MRDENKDVLIEFNNVRVQFKGKGKKPFVAVKDVSFQIYKGETFGLVGETGSGKTTIGRAIVRINQTATGDILFKGRKINGVISKELDREVTRKIQMIFQDPMASLNERSKVDYIVSEGLYNINGFTDEEDRKRKVEKALLEVGLLPEFASRFPHEFSGGQRQRIGIARALIMEPEFVIADEPISSLDVSIRAQILNLLSDLQKTKGLTYLFISHDLSVVRFIADRVAVIHKGQIVELAETEKLFNSPLHPYTRALLSAIPVPDPRIEKKKQILVYDPSCHDYSVDKPMWIEIDKDHFVLGNKAEIEQYREMLENPVAMHNTYAML
ncbi:MAG: ATP-binding cassette domain-containing protein [Firmicutes bacterium]|nr:ATP-binding cassette domain-containing protein [Candidatus Fermentithermobacillaceae bacterium]